MPDIIKKPILSWICLFRESKLFLGKIGCWCLNALWSVYLGFSHKGFVNLTFQSDQHAYYILNYVSVIKRFMFQLHTKEASPKTTTKNTSLMPKRADFVLASAVKECSMLNSIFFIKMTLSWAALKKLAKEEVINLALDYQCKFDSTFRSSYPEVFLRKGSYRRTPMLKCDFNRFALQLWLAACELW